MMSDSQQLILLRLAPELTTKAQGTRRRFTRRLVSNLSDALRSTGKPFDIENHWTRLFVHTAAEDAAQILARVPGISSLSPVEGRCRADLPEIVRLGTELFAERVRGRSYAVRARRAGSHAFTSADVQKELGATLNPGARVDLGNPEVEVEVEVRDRWAYLFSERVDGVGGLPLGVEGRAVCLLSGGFDSAVAAWLMLKRGVELDYVFCNLAGDAYERSVVQVAKVLSDEWSYGYRPNLHVIDFGRPLDELRARTQPRFWQLILKRLMYRAAAQVAMQRRASAIVTGEAIGQVSSQTLPNLRAIEGAIDLPVFRPLIGFDKKEIIELTRRIGTFDISSKVKEYCAIAPGNPVTNATLKATEREESEVDLTVVTEAARDRRILDLKEINRADLVASYLFTDRVPGEAVLIDVRPEDEWDEWHHPDAVRRDLWDAMSDVSDLDRDRTYVIYCGQGLQAAQLAEEMQRQGYEAYAFRGGIRALQEQAQPSAS
jgi:thiamine biosynthesis protein ThiI